MKRTLQRILPTPKGMLLVILLALTLLAMPAVGLLVTLPVVLSTVLAALLTDEGARRILGRRWRFPDGAILTGLILALVIDPFDHWYVPPVCAMLAIVSRELLRTRWSNIFNPAALGLVVATVLYGVGHRWWGALPDLPLPALLLLAVGGIFIVDQVNKLPLLAAFCGGYFAILTAVAYFGHPNRVAELFRPPDLHAMLFFALFMLTDPPTSPNRYREQIIFGVVVAAASCACYFLLGGVYFLLAGLLFGNLLESGRRLLLA